MVHIPQKCHVFGRCSMFGGVYVIMGGMPMFVVGLCSVVQAVLLVIVRIELEGWVVWVLSGWLCVVRY
jgi:hypothetical protein